MDKFNVNDVVYIIDNFNTDIKLRTPYNIKEIKKIGDHVNIVLYEFENHSYLSDRFISEVEYIEKYDNKYNI